MYLTQTNYIRHLPVTPLILCLLAAQVVCPWAALYNGLN